MNTTENNKLIAEFMGFRPDTGVSGEVRFHNQGECGEQKNFPKTYYKYDSDHYKEQDTYYLDELEYRESWEWLMPVLQKIALLSKEGDPTDHNPALHWGLRGLMVCLDIDKAYKAVVDFINWYNQNK